MIRIEEGDITLTTINREDIPFIAKKISEQNFFPQFENNILKIENNLKNMDYLWTQKLRFFMLINFRGKIIGCIDLYNFKLVEAEGELGYFLFKEFRENGYSVIAIKIFLKYLFSNIKLNTIKLRTNGDSSYVAKYLPKRLGFQKLKMKSFLSFTNITYFELKRENFLE